MLEKLMSLFQGKEYCIPYASTLEDNDKKQNKGFPARVSSSQNSPIDKYMETGLEPVPVKVVLYRLVMDMAHLHATFNV